MCMSSESLLSQSVIDTKPLPSKQQCYGNSDTDNSNVNPAAATLPAFPEVDSSFRNLPSFQEIGEELKALSRISSPTVITGLLIYLRSVVSMIFLGRLGKTELAAGSLAVGFGNITGYSIIFGLAMGIEPICGQAYGARNFKLLNLAFQRAVVILLLKSLFIAICWLNVENILNYLGQDQSITKLSKTYLLYSLPDLIVQSILHPLRIYLRTQNITQPIAICSVIASLMHIPINYTLVVIFQKGVKGVAMASVIANINLLAFLIIYIQCNKPLKETRATSNSSNTTTFSLDCFKELGSYLKLAVPSCISICLEWWWYELLIILCGLLENPEDTVSAIGIIIQITSLVYIFPSSLSYGVSTRVAQELGAGKTGGARTAAAVGTSMGGLTGVVAMGFTIWAKDWWAQMFTEAGGVVSLVGAALPIVGLCELGNCPQTAMCGVLRGCARPNLGARVNLWAFYGVGLPLAMVMGFWVGKGFEGLWVGLLGAQVACAGMLGVVLVWTDWEEQVKRAEEISGIRDDNDYESSVVGLLYGNGTDGDDLEVGSGGES